MILVDSDVLIDVALSRQPYRLDSERILAVIEAGFDQAAIAWHTAANLYYVVRRQLSDSAARDIVSRIHRTVSVSQTSSSDLAYALSLPMVDFEDAMQVAAARACGADFIVTRNLRDYRDSPIEAVSPQHALWRLS